MSWRSKVVWSEGLFLRPHHFQQGDRYLEWATTARTRNLAPFSWGFSRLDIDHGLAQRGKFGLEAAWGVMQDGTPFQLEGKEELPGASADRRQDRQSHRLARLPGSLAQHARGGAARQRLGEPLFPCLRDLHRLHLRAARGGGDRGRASAHGAASRERAQARLQQPSRRANREARERRRAARSRIRADRADLPSA